MAGKGGVTETTWTPEQAREAGDRGRESHIAAAKRRRELFCQEYVANGYNKSEAYMAAWGTKSPETARKRAWEIMKEPEVIARIDELIKERYAALHINAEKIAIRLHEMAFAAKDDEIYNTSVQLKALDMLQKQLGLQKQQIKAEVDGPTTIQVKINKKEEDQGE